MAELEIRKRKRADQLLELDEGPSFKKRELEDPRKFTYPPEFFDGLSKVELTHVALKELNRRNRAARRSSHLKLLLETAGGDRDDGPPSKTALCDEAIARFAENGGPDLLDLKGCPHPDYRPAWTMVSSSTASRLSNIKSEYSSIYNHNFAMHLTEHGIHRPYFLKEQLDVAEVEEALKVRRPSLSRSQVSQGEFKRFVRRQDMARDQDDVLATIIPTLLGQRTEFSTSRYLTCGRFDPLTDGTIMAPKPDIFDGASCCDLNHFIREELAGHVLPTEYGSIAPNFFIEVGGPSSRPFTTDLQARYHGAFGARAMHTLRNHGNKEPQYDDKAYTHCWIYSGGYLQLFAHHVTAPTTEGAKPEYHMTRIKSYVVHNSRREFIEGATAIRNSRDMAKKWRDEFIEAANEHGPMLPPPTPKAYSDEEEWEDESRLVIDCEDPVPSAEHSDLRDADDALQEEQIAKEEIPREPITERRASH